MAVSVISDAPYSALTGFDYDGSRLLVEDITLRLERLSYK